ncbi:MAG: hypothetical protein IGS39_24765 [Calothrix sp. C42_A2020_038]|nr:hypothetical protein [Calothrix sp. C42_A2020_038]
MIEDSIPDENQDLLALSNQVYCPTKNNSVFFDLDGLSFQIICDNSDLLALENIIKERRRVKNMLSILINNHNLEISGKNGVEQNINQVDEELLWLIQEYYRLSSLPHLTESDTKQMLLILELAQIDHQLDDFITKIDTALAEEVGIIETNSGTENSAIKIFKENFIKYLEQKLINSEDID